MSDAPWSAQLIAIAAAIFALTTGSVTAVADAVLTAIDNPAVVVETADRGQQRPVGEPPGGTTPYALPVAEVTRAGWSPTHSSYPATDIFVGCGATLLSPVNGIVLEVRRVDEYDATVDNPATRGGRSIAILGDDGVRYYMAHFESIEAGLEVGQSVSIGQVLGTMGDTGRASACHLHFAISPPCPGTEWSVRRGVIWPYPYLDAWKRGEQTSPVAEVDRWLADHPDACADAMADPYAPDA